MFISIRVLRLRSTDWKSSLNRSLDLSELPREGKSKTQRNIETWEQGNVKGMKEDLAITFFFLLVNMQR